MHRLNRKSHSWISRFLPILLILILISLPAIGCQDREAPLLLADELLDLGDDQDQSDDDDQDAQPQDTGPLVISDDLNDPVCCNQCIALTGMPLSPYADMSQVTFTWVVANGQCHGEWVLAFERAQNLQAAFMGGLTFYDPSGSLLVDDPFCWGRYGNMSYGFYTDSAGTLFPTYAYLDPDSMQWVVGDAPGFEVVTDTTEIMLRIPCDQIDDGFAWMIHIADPASTACDEVGVGTDLFPSLILPDVEF